MRVPWIVVANALPIVPALFVIALPPGIVADKSEAEQRYLTHETAHRLAVACGRYRTLTFVLTFCGLRFGEAAGATSAPDEDVVDAEIVDDEANEAK